MRKAKLIFYSLVLVGIIVALVFYRQIFDYFGPQLENLEKTATQIAIKEISKNVSAPPPLKKLPTKPSGTTSTFLTPSGTVKWTNIQRNQNGLPSLSLNEKLDSAALLRLEDMLKNQYFAHVSPSGSRAETVAEEVSYDYLALGENLAMGNFSSDKDLVEAWMNNPGHRANILNIHYTEIGVAVKAGVYEGKPVWIGIQIFGKPASACPKPDETLKSKIEAVEAEIKDLQAILAVKRTEIENSDRRAPDYNEKVAAYNELVGQYNSLLTQTKDLISQYNGQINVLNACIAN